jgi:sporulation protein YlmC with PRC-barrel domain
MGRLLPCRPPISREKHALLPTPAHNGVAKRTAVGATIQKASLELTMVSAGSGYGDYTLTMLKPQERTMAAFTGFRTSLKSGIDASALPSPSHLAPAARPRSSGWMIWTALAVTLAAGPALPQAGVQLVKVDLSVVAKGYRMSKLIGSSVINDKNEKIGTVDDVIADKDKKQLSFAVLQVGGFLGVGGHLVAVPYESLVIDDTGQKITLPGASKDELKKLSQFNYPAS